MTTRRLAGVLLLFVIGCSEVERPEAVESLPHAAATEPDPPPDTSRLGAAVWLGLPKNACPIEAALQRALGTAVAVDCGGLPRFAPASMRVEAQQCVLAAQTAGRAYRVSYRQSCDFALGDLCLDCTAVGLGHALCEEKEAL